MENLGVRMRRGMGGNRQLVIPYIILTVILIFYMIFQNDFFTQYGLQSLFNQVITLGVVVLGQTLVILTAGIDLSVGPMVGLTNSIAATIMVPMIHSTGSELLGIVVTAAVVLLTGTVTGLINGLIIVYGRLQPIIVTLATSSIFLGIALYIRPTPGGKVPDSYTNVLTGSLFGTVPVSLLVMVLFILLAWIPIRKSVVGQSIYAIGGNENSAFMSGISIGKTKLWAYTLNGLFCAFTGLLLTAQTASGDPLGAGSFTLNSIAATVLGGTSLFGGIGSYYGSIAGASIMSLVLGLLIFWNVSSFYQTIVTGGILILSITIGALRSRQAKAASMSS
ncbi:ABC transporter permease [Alicyclobacillus tolerans]|uniref:ABC transporter permease n=1 Tax=Alicyclobacillus tolerans TaxID=90970 RepID=UPI001F352C3B|nr:ABC transporter permease [Alicyclobacillus tolerans]MCF8566781.1 ABC transporter permease [Alicyclobacillus tolerans]